MSSLVSLIAGLPGLVAVAVAIEVILPMFGRKRAGMVPLTASRENCLRFRRLYRLCRRCKSCAANRENPFVAKPQTSVGEQESNLSWKRQRQLPNSPDRRNHDRNPKPWF